MDEFEYILVCNLISCKNDDREMILMDNRIYHDLGEAIRSARKEKGVTQKELCKAMLDKYKTESSTHGISDLENGAWTDPLTEKQQKILNGLRRYFLSNAVVVRLIDNVLERNAHEMEDIPASLFLSFHDSSQIISRYDSIGKPLLKKWLGDYHLIFRSTDSNDPSFTRGTLKIDYSTDKTLFAELRINDTQGNSIKKYRGAFFLHDSFKICYMVLIEETTQEVGLLICPYFVSNIALNKCFAALALTISAGTSKRPTMHRMLFSRKKLSENQAKLAGSQLKMNTDIIKIPLDELKCLNKESERLIKETTQESLRQVYALINEFCGIILKEGKQRVIVEIDESRLYDNQAFEASEEQRAVALSYIREIADVDFYNKISDTVRDVFSAVIDADYLK